MPPDGAPTLPDGVPTLPDGPATAAEATTLMPATDAPGGTPPGDTPPPTGFGGPAGNQPPTPWYKKPGPLIAALVALAAIAGVIAWLFLGGDDDDPAATAESSLLVLEVTDETGEALDTGFIVEVTGPPEAPSDYTWIQPADAVPGEIAGGNTGSDGRVEFEWEPAGVDSDPITWAATVSIAQQIPAGWTPPGPIVDCVLARPDAQDSAVSMAVEVDVPDAEADQIANYSFPNYQFLAGDTVTCQLSSIRPVETTTTSTTIEETTTTTVAETTTTTVAESTTTTGSTTTLVPVTDSAWEFIVADPELQAFEDFVLGLPDSSVQDLLEGPGPVTVFAPNNDAFTRYTGGEDVQVALAHISTVDPALTKDEALALPGGVPVESGGDQPVDATAGTIGADGATFVDGEFDQTTSNGFLHVITEVLEVPTN